MRIKLTQDVYGEDKDGNRFIRQTVRAESARYPDGLVVTWKVGREMDVSEATGAKMIAAGQAVDISPKPEKGGKSK